MSHLLYLYEVHFDFMKLISADVAEITGNYQLCLYFRSRTERHKQELSKLTSMLPGLTLSDI